MFFARLGPKKLILKEQNHTISLYNRGFPVAKILSHGETPDGQWYFTETSLGETTFHEIFEKEYKNNAEVSHQTCRYQINSLSDGGILQFDLNPFNVLKNGIIDFELVGYGPIAYDVLMSARWGGSWFTDYPSLHSTAYKLTNNQIKENDKLVSNMAAENDLTDPMQYLQEFLLLKSTWAASDFNPPQDNWPKNKIAFRRYRANVLKTVIKAYLSGNIIDCQLLSGIPGGELD